MHGPSGLTWDVWIVDNNSKDETRALVESFAQREPRIHYLFEGAQGKAHAINKAVRQADASVIAFTDDDCIPDERWVESIGSAFAADANLGLVGGRVELFNPLDNPMTTRTSRDRRIVSAPGDALSFIIGCNMAIRSELLSTIGDFDPLITPGNGKDAGFEDADFVYRAFKKDIRIEYLPNVLVYHNHGRRSESDVADVHRKYVRGRGSFYVKHIFKGDRSALRMACWELQSTLGDLAKKLLSGKSAREEVKMLSFLFGGAMTRFL